MAEEVGQGFKAEWRLVDLGQGLELWKIPVGDLREQDVNARVMSSKMFDRLSSTIGRDKRLESLPLCAKTPKGVEVVSGHHRLRAAISAGLADIHCIVDVTGLSKSQIRAKQLAHNSIQGEDNQELIAKIFASIDDAESRLEAFIDSSKAVEPEKVRVQDIAVPMLFKNVGVVFMPIEKAAFEQAAKELVGTVRSAVHGRVGTI